MNDFARRYKLKNMKQFKDMTPISETQHNRQFWAMVMFAGLLVIAILASI